MLGGRDGLGPEHSARLAGLVRFVGGARWAFHVTSLVVSLYVLATLRRRSGGLIAACIVLATAVELALFALLVTAFSSAPPAR